MAATTSSVAGAGERFGGPPPSGLPRPVSARIGKYEVEAEIGNNATVKIFRALDRDTGRPVTLKVLTDVADRTLIERFRREVSAAANLRSRNFIAIYELGEHVGLPFAAMQHLSGDDLRHAIRKHRSLSLLEKMLIMWQLAEGVQAALRSGLAYLGIRPSGITVASDGSVTIEDFGIVRLGGAHTGDGASYQAPEEAAASFAPDALCDIFAYGAIYYELLTGKHPEPVPIRDLAPDCPEALERLVTRALEKQRELRYQSLDDIQFDAEPILRDLKRSRASVLSAEVRRLMDAQKLDDAQILVREVLELDADNYEGQRLRTTLRDLSERRRVQPRIQASLREADEEMAAQHFAKAAEILKAALRLDGSNAEVRSRLDQVTARLEQMQRCSQLVAEGRRLLDQKNFTAAHDRASEALDLDPFHGEASDLLQAIGDAILRQEREANIEQRLAQAKSLLLLQSFDEALAILDELRTEFPESPLVEHWLAHVQEQKTETAVRGVLEEAEWLLKQNRPDLAAQFLREKSAELPEQHELHDRLAEIEKTLPEWEKRRFIQDSLNRSTALEQAQQWPVALTVLEEALETCPEAHELHDAAERLRTILRDQEHHRKLARRLETIGQKMASQAWAQALPLIEAAQTEFPGEPEIELLLAEAQAGIRRTECETIVAEVRRCLADGEADQADETLRRALDTRADEPLLLALRDELEADKRYREEWRTAQIYFGRRQFHEAEQILVRLAAQKRPEAQALLETVRESRAASEEENFYKRGREKALKLIQMQQYEQAADLLRNLLSLFPGDPILERDLQSVPIARPEAPEPAVAVAPVVIAPPAPEPRRAVHERAPRKAAVISFPAAAWVPSRARRREAVIAAMALLLLLTGVIVWRLSRNKAPARASVPVSAHATAPAASATPIPVPARTPSLLPAASLASTAAVVSPKPAAPAAQTEQPAPKASEPQKLRPFSLPATQPVRGPLPVIPPPPGTVVLVSNRDTPGLPANLLSPVTGPAPPAAASGAPTATPESGARLRLGGQVTEPKLISRPSPVLPAIAKTRAIYGTVKLEATVNEQGVVTNVDIKSGNQILALAAKEAVRQWRYQPATLNGEATPVQVLIDVVFQESRK